MKISRNWETKRNEVILSVANLIYNSARSWTRHFCEWDVSELFSSIEVCTKKTISLWISHIKNNNNNNLTTINATYKSKEFSKLTLVRLTWRSCARALKWPQTKTFHYIASVTHTFLFWNKLTTHWPQLIRYTQIKNMKSQGW